MATLSLLKHLDAVTSFLNHMQGHADFSQRRHEQYVSCKQKIQNCRSIQISESGPLLEKLSKMPWETDQSKVLQGEVAALVEGGELVDRGRRSLQNYTTFPWYLPSRIWLYVLNPQEAAASLRMMTDHLIKLGLCLPSEKTCSRVTALYVLHKHHNMSAEALHQEYLNVKNYIRRQIQNTGKNDTPFLTDLPANPNELPAELYQKVFEGEQPLSPQVDMVQLNWIQSQIKERWNQSVSRPAAGTLLSAGSLRQHEMQHALPSHLAPPATFCQQPVLSQQVVPSTCLQLVPALPQAREQLALPAPASQQQLALPAMSVSEAAAPALDLAITAKAEAKMTPKKLEAKLDMVQPKEIAIPAVQQDQANQGPELEAHVTPFSVAKELEKKLKGGSSPVMKKPSAVMKKPSVSSKAPAAKPVDVKKTLCKKPAAKKVKKDLPTKGWPEKKSMPSEYLRSKYPNGCPKCRYKAGCTPSCFRQRKELA